MTTLSQKSFSGGEIAPSLYARTDTQKYQNGLRTCRNNLVMRHGGTSTRPGTKHLCETKYRNRTVRLVPFEFSDDDTYILEFGHLYMRVIKNGSLIYKPGSLFVTGITNANPAVVTSTAHGLLNGAEVMFRYIEGMTQINNRSFKVANKTANTFELHYLDDTPVDSTSWGTFGSSINGLFVVYELATKIQEPSLSIMQFVQSADVMFFASHDFPPTELKRTGEADWSIAYMTFAPGIAAPVGGSATPGGTTGSTTYRFRVTAVDNDTNEESLPSSNITTTTGNASPSATNFITVTWSTVPNAREYNLYLEVNGVFGYLGIANGTSYKWIGNDADVTDSPPSARNPFSFPVDEDGEPANFGQFPACVTLFQQRLCWGNTKEKPETVWLSKTGAYRNLTTSVPLQDDDSITYGMAGRKINAIRHLLDLTKFVNLTQNTEFTVEGDGSGIIRPAEINPRAHTYNGSSWISPIVSGGNALYVQARGSIVRDLGFDYSVDGYRGSDLTIFSAHLFDGYEITSWDYQQVPHSIIWAARNDGTMLGLTYLREHQMLAWHRHDLEDGFVENIAVIPEGEEDSVYLVVRREVEGVVYRSVERMVSRQIRDIVDYVQMDSAMTYDGRSEERSITLSSEGGWTYTDTIQIDTFPNFFVPGDVGNFVHVAGVDTEGNKIKIRIKITSVTDETTAMGKPNRTVPAPMRDVSLDGAVRAVDRVTGLWHLEGKKVSVIGDGFVVANPHNDAYGVLTVLNGAIDLPQSYSVIHVGLPITCDLETLDIEAQQGETLIDKKTRIGRVWVHVEKSRGMWIGPRPPENEDEDFLGDLTEFKPRQDEGWDDPPALITDKIGLAIKAQWNSNGRIFIRQTDPIPMSILSIAPDGNIAIRQ